MRRFSLFAMVLLALAGGTWLRLWFLWHFPQVNGDGLVYGDIAKNWLMHGIYGRTEFASAGATVNPTLIRLPGYPLFLVACFRIFGVDHYGAVLYLQVLIDLLSALIVAWTTRMIAGNRAGLWALCFAALCPFTANYVAAPLSETLSIFCVSVGCAALVWVRIRPGWSACLLLAVSWGYAALLRPDGALLAVAGFLAIVLFAGRPSAGGEPLGRARARRLAIGAGILSAIPFLFWTARNFRVFHVFEPLAPRYATDPGEFTAPGFQRWMKTWVVDFASTSEIYWNAETDPMDAGLLPSRAFDSPAQKEETADIFAAYNERTTITPAIDARFDALAAEREHAHPLRSYLELPLLRVMDMWLRPRTEMLNIELRWWQYDRHNAETEFATGYAALNLAYIVLAAIGAWRLRHRETMLVFAIVTYCVLRSLLLSTIEAPEARYTIEVFPMLCILAGTACGAPGAGAATRGIAPTAG
ncbi:MAG TPA: glycosyltransferase family 39 protein [Terracidiphilus sp.]